ncbi:unnamed protein product [Malus baccata var. baccata]
MSFRVFILKLLRLVRGYYCQSIWVYKILFLTTIHSKIILALQKGPTKTSLIRRTVKDSKALLFDISEATAAHALPDYEAAHHLACYTCWKILVL